MARPPRPPRIQQWRGDYWLFDYDHYAKKPRRRKCSTLGAHTAEQRAELQKQIRYEARVERSEVEVRGGAVAFRSRLIVLVDEYLEAVDLRVELREANPTAADGLAPASGRELRYTIGAFRKWLVSRGLSDLRTGELDGSHLKDFFRHMASASTTRGHRRTRRGAATMNKHRRNIRSMINDFDDRHPPVFPRPGIFKRALKAEPARTAAFHALSPTHLSDFLNAALDHEQPGRTVSVVREHGGTVTRHAQTAESVATTPVSRLFVVLALTGMRLGEALELKWSAVDLDLGRIRIYGGKTRRERLLPLVEAPEGHVAPTLLALLRCWSYDDPGEFVLPHRGREAPLYPKKSWEKVNAALDHERITPQTLRKNFCSYLASLGVPSAVAALWQGHSTKVAEDYYRGQVLSRGTGASVDAATGLAPIIRERML